MRLPGLALAFTLAACASSTPVQTPPPATALAPPPSAAPPPPPPLPPPPAPVASGPLVPVFQSYLPHFLDGILFRWSPDGSALLAADIDTVQVRDGATGQLRGELRYDAVPGVSIADWTPRGDAVAVIAGGALHVWSMRDGTVTDIPGPPGAPSLGAWPGGGWLQLVWSGDGAHVLATHPGGFLAWDLAQRRSRAFERGPDGSCTFAWSADGRAIAATTRDGAAVVLDAESGATRFVVREDGDGGADAAVRAVAWSADGKSLAVAGDSRVVRLVDPATGAVLRRTPDLRFAVGQLAWSPDGRRLAVYFTAHDDPATGRSQDRLVLWEPGSDQARVVPDSSDSGVAALRWAPAGDRLALEVGQPTSFVHATIVDATRGAVVVPRQEGILDPTFTRALVRQETERPPTIVDVATKRTLATLRRQGDTPVIGVDPVSGRLARWPSIDDPWVLSPDGRAIARVRDGGAVTVEDVATGAPVGRRIDVPGLAAGAEPVAWSPRGKYVTAVVEQGDARSFVVFDARTGAGAATLPMASPIDAFRWSPDESAVSVAPVGKEDGYVCHVFAVPGGKERFARKGERFDPGVWSADGRRLLLGNRAAGEGALGGRLVVDGRTGAPVTTLDGPALSGWSPHGRRLAVRLPTGATCVWDEPSKKCVATLALRPSSADTDPHPAQDVSLRWTPSGTKLARDIDAAEIELYDATTGALVRTRAHPWTREIRWVDDDHVLVQLTELWLLRLSDGTTLRAARGDDGTGVLVLAPDGTFDGDESARGRLLFRQGSDVVNGPLRSTEAARDKLHPGLWASLLGPKG